MVDRIDSIKKMDVIKEINSRREWKTELVYQITAKSFEILSLHSKHQF